MPVFECINTSEAIEYMSHSIFVTPPGYDKIDANAVAKRLEFPSLRVDRFGFEENGSDYREFDLSSLNCSCFNFYDPYLKSIASTGRDPVCIETQ